MVQDPDDGVKGACDCSNGVTISPTTYISNGEEAVGCPWTTIPPAALTTAAPTTTTNDRQYQFTYTDASKKVIECQTYTTGDYPGVDVSFCAGSTVVLYATPLATMEMGSSKVNVGSSMTGEALFTTVSNALTSLCPIPNSGGAWTSCETGSIAVGSAVYLESGKPEDGELTLYVTDAQYRTSDYLNLFINMIAGAANATASGENCAVLDWSYTTEGAAKRNLFGRIVDPPAPSITHDGNSTFCNINGFLDTQWYDGVQEAAKMWLETEFDFELSEMGEFDCMSTLGVVEEVIGAIFEALLPEFSWLIATGVELGELACEAVDTFNPTKSKRRIDDER